MPKNQLSNYHGVEEAAQGPDGEALPLVAPMGDPLGRAVDYGAVKPGVVAWLDDAAGPEVDEGELEGVEVDQQVLVLDVPVHDPPLSAGDHNVRHLTYKSIGYRKMLFFAINMLVDANS